MALAGIDTLLIQASYSQRPAESRCLGQGRGQGRKGVRAGGSYLSVRCGSAARLPAPLLAGCEAVLCLICPICKMEIIPVLPSQGSSQVRLPRSQARDGD